MSIKAFVCTSCDTTIYSRSIADSCDCQCGRVNIAGGPENPTVTVNNEELALPNLIDLDEPNLDADILYWDWNLMRDEYGYITTSKLDKKNELHTA